MTVFRLFCLVSIRPAFLNAVVFTLANTAIVLTKDSPTFTLNREQFVAMQPITFSTECQSGEVHFAVSGQYNNIANYLPSVNWTGYDTKDRPDSPEWRAGDLYGRSFDSPAFFAPTTLSEVTYPDPNHYQNFPNLTYALVAYANKCVETSPRIYTALPFGPGVLQGADLKSDLDPLLVAPADDMLLLGFIQTFSPSCQMDVYGVTYGGDQKETRKLINTYYFGAYRILYRQIWRFSKLWLHMAECTYSMAFKSIDRNYDEDLKDLAPITPKATELFWYTTSHNFPYGSDLPIIETRDLTYDSKQRSLGLSVTALILGKLDLEMHKDGEILYRRFTNSSKTYYCTAALQKIVLHWKPDGKESFLLTDCQMGITFAIDKNCEDLLNGAVPNLSTTLESTSTRTSLRTEEESISTDAIAIETTKRLTATSPSPTLSPKTIGLIAGGALLAVIAVFVVGISFYRKRTRLKHIQSLFARQTVVVRHKDNLIRYANQPHDYLVDPWEIDLALLQIENLIGRGAVCDVLEAKLQGNLPCTTVYPALALVKISDFGQSKVSTAYYYSGKGKTSRSPLKWAAPEAIETGKYSEASDVWSFGILLWEMHALGDEPFSDILLDDLLAHLKYGGRPAPNADTPSWMVDIMKKCWEPGAADRPAFQDLTNIFRDNLKERRRTEYYLDINILDEQLGSEDIIETM
ncbi:unnamed protein product, partial [Mesorhabditis spiculigera]